MADKAITDLNTIPGSVDDNNTWFAVAQSGTAYKVSGHEFTLALGTILDGHGGVKSIVYTPPTPPSLTGTMVITLADNSTTTVNVENGKGISSIAKVSTAGLVDTYQITYNDNSTPTTFTVTNGAKGDTGDSWYVWIKYAGSQPTQDSDMGDTPDDWIGIYSGISSTAPAHYTDYEWYEYKGEKGDTGDAATITTQNVSYQESSSGTVAPSGSWTTTIPSVTPGNFLWTRTQLAFNDGTTVTSYSVSRYGIDGTGAVSTVNNISPDGNGNIALTGTDIPLSDNQSIQTHVTDAEDDIAELKTSLNSKANADASNISSAQTWRNALGLGTSGELPITIEQGGTGATTASGARTNLGLAFGYSNDAIANGTSKAISLASNTRGFMVATGAGTGARDVICWSVSNTGAVTHTQIRSAGGLALTDGTNKLTIANSSGAYAYLMIFTY